jgi:hypothetical protein
MVDNDGSGTSVHSGRMKVLLATALLAILSLFTSVVAGFDYGGPDFRTPIRVAGIGSSFGTYFTPIDFPSSYITLDPSDANDYFYRGAHIGRQTGIIQRWAATVPDHSQVLIQVAHEWGFKFSLQFDPLTPMTRQAPAIPASVGGSSFADASVRAAYLAKVLQYASYGPDILGLGVEVNLLLYNNNAAEFANFVSLEQQAYQAIKAQYPNVTVTVSFSWDILRQQSPASILSQFSGAVDAYAFTSYPNVLTTSNAEDLPADFYSSIRTYLPSDRVGISEIAWYSGGSSSEASQAEFFQRLPTLLEGLGPEFVTLTYLYDPAANAVSAPYNSMGLLQSDGTPKMSWSVITSYGKRGRGRTYGYEQ